MTGYFIFTFPFDVDLVIYEVLIYQFKVHLFTLHILQLSYVKLTLTPESRDVGVHIIFYYFAFSIAIYIMQLLTI